MKTATRKEIRRAVSPIAPYRNVYEQAHRTHDNLRGMYAQIRHVTKALRAGPRPALPEAVKRQALAIRDTRARFEYVAQAMQCSDAEIEHRALEATQAQLAWLVIFVVSIFAGSITANMGLSGIHLTACCMILAASSATLALVHATHRTVLRERDCITPRDMGHRPDLFAKWLWPWA